MRRSEDFMVPTITEVAAGLAIRTVALVLPGTRHAPAADILEARNRLRDQLAQFWGAMLRLSGELSQRIQCGSELSQRDINNVIDAVVRPATIELVNKLEKERRLWFRRILGPIGATMRVFAGQPQGDLATMLARTLVGGADAAFGAVDHFRQIEALRQSSGLTYLVELQKRIGGRG
jgi:hypothetical protein